jgi:dTDP-4-dehydrorhamnose reductase
MRFLVTGASGLFGGRFVELALDRGYEVYSGYYTHRPMVGNIVRFDITDVDGVRRVVDRVSPDVIVHSAALTNVDLCEKDRDLAYKTNVLGTKNLLEVCGGKNVFFVYISTDYVFDGLRGNYSEEDPTNPINHYGYTKLLGEKLVIDSGLDYLIARPSVIYGSRPASGKVNFALWLVESLREGRKVRLLVDQFVSPTLNTSLASMVLEAVERGLNGVFHMSGSERISRFEFGIKLAEVFGFDSSLIMEACMGDMNWVARRPRDSSLDVSKASRLLRNKPLNVLDSLKILLRELKDVAGDRG